MFPPGSPASITIVEKRFYIAKNNNVIQLSRSSFRYDLKKEFAGNQKILSFIEEIKYTDLIKNITEIISDYNDNLLKGTMYTN